MSTASPVDVPSGQLVTALEYLSDHDASGLVLRARYVAPDLAEQSDTEVVFSDMAHLCETDALPIRETMDDKPARIIVSLSSEAIEFGAINADVTQFFEAYAVETGRCIWELF